MRSYTKQSSNNIEINAKNNITVYQNEPGRALGEALIGSRESKRNNTTRLDCLHMICTFQLHLIAKWTPSTVQNLTELSIISH